MLSLETILKDTIWVVKFCSRSRIAGTRDEVQPWIDKDPEDVRDMDVSCEQPDHLKDFYDKYWKYDEEHGFTFIQDYYNNVYSKVVS